MKAYFKKECEILDEIDNNYLVSTIDGDMICNKSELFILDDYIQSNKIKPSSDLCNILFYISDSNINTDWQKMVRTYILCGGSLYSFSESEGLKNIKNGNGLEFICSRFKFIYKTPASAILDLIKDYKHLDKRFCIIEKEIINSL